MFAAERFKKIKEILLEYKHVDVNTLSSLLSVSIATVRRDLDKLEEEGFLKKAHGGAIINETNEFEVQLSSFEDPFHDEKVQIGLIASEMVDHNDIIFLGSGYTCLQIAKNIKDKRNVTVVTNNINAVLELAYSKNTKVIMPGGDLEVVDSYLGMAGPFALNNLEKIFINKTFVTVNGISIEHGYTVNSREQAALIDLLIKNSNETVVVADYSKFGRRAFTQVGPVHLFKKVITNVQLENRYKEYFFDNGIKLFTTYEENKNI